MAFRRQQRSLFVDILDWMLVPLLLLWPLGLVLTWLVAQGIANHTFDQELGEVARAAARRVGTGMPLVQGPTSGRHDGETVWFQLRSAEGHVTGGAAEVPPPRDDDALPGELRFRDETLSGAAVRVVALRTGSDEAPVWLQVAETLHRRSALSTDIIKGVMLPQVVMLPLAVLLVWLALARGIAPLNDLQRRIRQRDSDDLSPIDVRDAHEEVSPLVLAINDLLERLDQSLGAQKHFLTDAAHQLKTPLAGLRMQAELAEREIDAGHADLQALKRSLRHMARSSQRAAHMVNQLLAMARAENRELAAGQRDVDMRTLVADAVRDFVPNALDKRIDLGFETAREGVSLDVRGHPTLLRELVANLIDNALHYTPAGGTVTVRAHALPGALDAPDAPGATVVVEVEDSGPGIPAAERDRIFQPFYRVLGTEVDGSGLGLAIVREIARQHRAQVQVEDAAPEPGGHTGARFLLRLPALSTVATPAAAS